MPRYLQPSVRCYIPVSLLDSCLSAPFPSVLHLSDSYCSVRRPCVEVGNGPERQNQPETGRIMGINDGKGAHPGAIP